MSHPALLPAGAASIRTRLSGVIAVLLAIWILRVTQPVVMPIVAGLLVAAMVWPVKRWLERFLPHALALLTTVLFVIAIVAALFGGIAWSGARVAERVLEQRERLQSIERDLREAASSVGIPLPDGLAGSGGKAAGGQQPAGTDTMPAPPGGEAGARSPGSWSQRLPAAVISSLGALALTIAFMALALSEARTFHRTVRARFAEATAGRIIGIAGEVAGSVQRYFVVKSLTSLITGVATLLLTLALGLDFAALWGLLAFLLEYVPTIGSILAVVPPALYAAIQFDGYTRPLVIGAALTAMQLVLGNYVDPKIEGRYLSLSPFVVLASIVTWAWLWGAPGALLGVPLTIAIATTAKHFESSRWIWALLTRPEREEDGA